MSGLKIPMAFLHVDGAVIELEYQIDRIQALLAGYVMPHEVPFEDMRNSLEEVKATLVEVRDHTDWERYRTV